MDSNDNNKTSAGVASEEDVLASLGTTRANTTSYESDVIRQATHQLAPTLSLNDVTVGFPDLLSTSLLPFPVQGQAKANRQVVIKMLSKLQAQFLHQQHNSTTPDEFRIMAMKQQMLLSMLGTHSKKASIQKCWQDQEKVEEFYKIQAQSNAAAPRKARVPMQQRKQIPGAAKVAKLAEQKASSNKSKNISSSKKKKSTDWSDSEDSISSDEDTTLYEMNVSRRRQQSSQERKGASVSGRKHVKKASGKRSKVSSRPATTRVDQRNKAQAQKPQPKGVKRPTRKRSPIESYAPESDHENAFDKEVGNEETRNDSDNVKNSPISIRCTGSLVDDDLATEQEKQEDAKTSAANTISAETPEMPNDNIAEKDHVRNKQEEVEDEAGTKGGVEVAENDTQDRASSTATHIVSCPLCQVAWEVPDLAQIDNKLAEHMAQCQGGGRATRRSTRRRAQSVPVSYKETENDLPDEEDADSRPTRAGKRKHEAATVGTAPAKKQIILEDEDDFVFDDDVGGDNDDDEEYEEVDDRKRPAQEDFFDFDDDVDVDEEIATEPELSQPNSIDDYRLDDYEDRVDYWRLYGVQEMRDMSKLRAEGEIVPGAVTLQGGLYIPAWMNSRLFGYQRTGVEWMWQLHQQEAGGVIGDEMGLGKTVQVSSFLGAMSASRMIKAALIISPATMLRHWLTELATWAPGLRRVLLHSSGDASSSSLDVSGRNVANQGQAILRNLRKWLKKSRRDRVYERIDHPEENDEEEEDSFCGTGYAIITTYEHVRRNQEMYVNHPWSYVVMDEAQKIRNPVADITLACKRLRTPHRLAMTGTPIQNDLKELWSLFDFVFPGRLGTLPAFEQEFADPIKRGGYSNASPVQVQLAYRCSLVLRDLIDPYLLRRQKSEVEEVNRMPGKTEHVLFCRLSKRQRRMYEAYLKSDTVSRIFKGSTLLFAAVTMLRKICNHPDLVVSDPSDAALESFIRNGCVPDHPLDSGEDDDDNCEDDTQVYDEESLAERSGKFEVLAKILPLWKKQGHRVLIFCQWKKMLNIIQKFVHAQGWKFSRLDGNTSVASRQKLVDTFNSDPSYFGMLCTTRTGGVGLNLTGANRIILYDIDWNPQTDAQARERAWRFGQEKEVAIYRLCTAGTIEEKMYQRQIFKTALTNKVLHDPRQRRLFSQKDLHDLLTLQPDSGRAKAGGGDLVDTASRIARADQSEGDTRYSNNSYNAGAEDDDGETLRSVLKSKGLAGVFDHNFVDSTTSTNKSGAVREMEEQAKRIANEAAKALRESINTSYEEDAFTPTWTGAPEESRFGGGSGARGGKAREASSITAGVQGSGAGPKSSGSLLASLRQQNAAVKTGGRRRPSVTGNDSASSTVGSTNSKYTKLLVRIRKYVKSTAPKTDELLDEFSNVPDEDAAIFRRLLKSVARKGDDGRWLLQEEFL